MHPSHWFAETFHKIKFDISVIAAVTGDARHLEGCRTGDVLERREYWNKLLQLGARVRQKAVVFKALEQTEVPSGSSHFNSGCLYTIVTWVDRAHNCLSAPGHRQFKWVLNFASYHRQKRGIRTNILLLTPELESGKLDRSATPEHRVIMRKQMETLSWSLCVLDCGLNQNGLFKYKVFSNIISTNIAWHLYNNPFNTNIYLSLMHWLPHCCQWNYSIVYQRYFDQVCVFSALTWQWIERQLVFHAIWNTIWAGSQYFYKQRRGN